MKVKKLWKKKEVIPESRTVFVHDSIPQWYATDETLPQYCNNVTKTSKYTLLSFLPKNLYEQFRRVANFYFLCLCIIHFNIVSPVSPMTSLLPLLFVVTVTGIKQGYEDFRRHREDSKVNRTPTIILDEEDFIDAYQNEICVGDVVKIKCDEEFPCDLVLIYSPHPEGKCDVTTANLDGETNLKTFEVPLDLRNLLAAIQIHQLSGVIQCQQPHPNLYDFKGRMLLHENDIQKTIPLTTNHLLLRGARLKNTSFIYGCAVYTGKDTKLALNSKMTNNKFSTVEKTLNKFLLAYLGVLVALVFLCTTLKYQVYDLTKLGDMWYLGDIDVSIGPTFGQILQDAFAFVILFSYLIPISLYVTLELQKFLSTFFFVWDEELRCPDTGEGAVCNTSDLNEELGQVQYLFTDKTGTLTENLMSFRECSIAGVRFFDGSSTLRNIDQGSIKPTPDDVVEKIEDFLITLALCHTVKVKKGFNSKNDHSDDDLEQPDIPRDEVKMETVHKEYLASSPDEKALVEACDKYGVVYDGESGGKCIVLIQGEKQTYKRLDVLEFDSDRKLMSVIVEDEEGDIWLLTKGAEISVLKRCSTTTSLEEDVRDLTLKHIDDYAMLGLRTLAVGRRKISSEEYLDVARKLAEARGVIEDRDVALRKVFDEVEKDLELQGATGVEDLLQDGVQETLQSLSVAGIKVWILTGDKVETAVNIAHLCGLFKRFMSILYLTHIETESAAESMLEECMKELADDNKNYGLVVDGTSLLLLMEEYQDEFYRVCSNCSAVVCCRMSPKQKAEIVRLVKFCGGEGLVCAAIGDGANDVSMIQEAHIGLGIMGKEGRQAVRCSDFAFSKFRFLRKALLVHGHWFYTRISTLVHYCFYKNVAFIMAQLFYTFACAYSTESVYEGASLTFFNIFFTSAPIMIYGLSEQVYSSEYLLNNPLLYKEIVGNKNMTWKVFITWGLLGFWHSTICYFGLLGATYDDTAGLPGGRTQDLYLFGMGLTTIIVWICNIKLMLETRHHNIIFVGSIIITLVGYDIFYLIYSGTLPKYGAFYTFYVMHTSWCYIFSFAILLIMALIPDVIVKVCLNWNDRRKIPRYFRMIGNCLQTILHS